MTAVYSRPFLNTLNLSYFLTSFFLFQYFLNLGMALELKSQLVLFMATLPIVAALFAVQSDCFSTGQQKVKKAFGIIGVMALSLFLTMSHPELRSDMPISMAILVSFCLWQMGTIYLANMEWLRLSRKTLFRIIKNKNLKNQSENGDAFDVHPLNRERYFFHDIINHTHGMGLMLRYRLLKEKGLTYEETISLSAELQALQTLVQDHFGLNHRNTSNDWEWKSFSFLKNMTVNLVHSFLPESQVDSFFTYKGTLAEGESFNPCVAFAPYHRILTNLVKNCAEAGSKRVEFIFDGRVDDFTLTLKNDVYKEKPVGYDLGKSLEYLISGTTKDNFIGHGVGLESIETLCKEQGGSFHFYIENGHWVSQITLPFNKDVSNLDESNYLEIHKKMAS